MVIIFTSQFLRTHPQVVQPALKKVPILDALLTVIRQQLPSTDPASQAEELYKLPRINRVRYALWILGHFISYGFDYGSVATLDQLSVLSGILVRGDVPVCLRQTFNEKVQWILDGMTHKTSTLTSQPDKKKLPANTTQSKELSEMMMLCSDPILVSVAGNTISINNTSTEVVTVRLPIKCNTNV